MVKQPLYILFASLFLIVGAACSGIGTSIQEEIPGDVISDDYEGSDDERGVKTEDGPEVTTDDGPETTGLSDEGSLPMDALDALSEGGDLSNVVYFDYDSYQVREDSLPLVTSVAEALAASPERQLRLEGHADERGTREYNLALGERRAQAVRELILIHGVNSDQIDVVSYGEENPAVVGSDEESWQKNRRVELIADP